MPAHVQRFGGAPLEAAIIRHQLSTLLLRLARELAAASKVQAVTREAEIHALFARALEAGCAQRLSVLDDAKRLGFSESSLARAGVATVGRTAKDEIDSRVALEAKRLLMHSQACAAQIAHQLGVTEPTNFVKFFRGKVGCTPLALRHSHAAGAQGHRGMGAPVHG